VESAAARHESLVPDGYYRAVRLALEVDSAEHHAFGDGPELTEQRRAKYAALGWRVVSISPRRIRQEPKAVLAEIEAAYLADTSDAA
jgi:very-short-patch-repair endonuclease